MFCIERLVGAKYFVNNSKFEVSPIFCCGSFVVLVAAIFDQI